MSTGLSIPALSPAHVHKNILDPICCCRFACSFARVLSHFIQPDGDTTEDARRCKRQVWRQLQTERAACEQRPAARRGAEPGRPLRAARSHPAMVRCLLAVWRADAPCLPPAGSMCLYVRAAPYLAPLARSLCTTTTLPNQMATKILTCLNFDN